MAARRREPEILISESALEGAISKCAAAAPYETGGLLIGVSIADGLWITDAIEIPVAKRHRSRFTIPAGVTHAAIDAQRRTDSRLGYLGDWHSHPAEATASNRDLTTLTEIAIGALGRRRLMAILRMQSGRWCLDLWWTPRFRVPRRLGFELAGPIAPERSPVVVEP